MRSGFVTLIGRTNAGKSSLLNYLLDQKISMVSHKQNATRRKILGIVMNGHTGRAFPGSGPGNMPAGATCWWGASAVSARSLP